MSDWKTVKLGDVCQINNGGTPDSKNKVYWGGDVQWLTPKDMGKLNNRYIKVTDRQINKDGLNNSSAKLIPENSVILSSRAPIGHLAINFVPMSFNQGCRGLVPNSELLTEFLYYFLFSSKQLLNDLGTGTTFKEISNKTLSNVKIPLPSLAEQQRIVAKLDAAFTEIDTAITAAEASLINTKGLINSALGKIFEQENWEMSTLDDVCIVERGSSPRPIKNFIAGSDGVNWIKIGDTNQDGKYVSSTRQKITKEGAKKSRYVSIGDFILTNSMSYGRPYIMAIDGCIHDGWFVLRLNKDIDTEYFYYLLSSPLVQNQFRQLAAGSVVKNISGDLVKKTKLPILPKDRQIKIRKWLVSIEKHVKEICHIQNQKIANYKALKSAILTQELQPKNENYIEQ